MRFAEKAQQNDVRRSAAPIHLLPCRCWGPNQYSKLPQRREPGDERPMRRGHSRVRGAPRREPPGVCLAGGGGEPDSLPSATGRLQQPGTSIHIGELDSNLIEAQSPAASEAASPSVEASE
jgi:hypothetical protein